MLRPLLIIGVGGSGGKTIRAMKQALTRKLEAARYEGGIPAAWQFLQIDTTIDGISFPAPMLRADEYHCVVKSGQTLRDITNKVENLGTPLETQKMLAGWSTSVSPIAINYGAGQIRAIGRLALVADAAATLKAIQNAIAKMSSPTALGEFGEVAKVLGGTPYPEPQAFIVSSFAGGSGAGMFLDVAELLKRATSQIWAENVISFLYTPEVFSSIGAAGRGVAMNSLGVMNELIASKWVGLSEQSELLYSKLGLAPGNSVGKRGYGCKSNFLISPRNDRGVDIRFGPSDVGMDQVFLNVGEDLAAAISDDEISDFLYFNAFISVSGYRPAVDVSGLAPESVNGDSPTLAAAGIGFGQMNLGADRIVDYVADAMTRAQIEKLLWPELDPMILKQGVSPSELVHEKSNRVWPNFLIDSGLDQRGSQNQITDALFPDQLQDRIKQYVDGLIKKNVTPNPVPIATFTRAVWSEWENEFDAFLEILKSEMSSKSQVWVPEIQEKIRNLVAHELAQNGYAVLTNLSERLEIELREHVIPELMRDHSEFANALSSFDRRVFEVRVVELADGLTGVSTQNGPFLGNLSSSLSRVLEFHVNSYVSNLAASLVEDMLSFFIEPLKNRLVDSRMSLNVQVRQPTTPSGSRNFYPEFPLWGSGTVPNRYKPSALERILIDFSEYESTYEFYAGRDTNGAPPFQQSVSDALIGKKINSLPGAKYEQTLITVINRWTTSVRDAQGPMGSAVSKADWTLHTDIAELCENNRRWLRIPDSSFGRFTDMSIRCFVSTAFAESLQVLQAREAKFVQEFIAMINVASPLVLLNHKASAHIVSAGYGGSAFGIMLKSSKIPFAMSSNVGQACVSILQQYGFNPSNAYFESTWFDAGSDASSMSAVATHMDSLPAWAFASLTEPILEEVTRSENSAQTWAHFWNGRRSRPLVECIPFETEMRRSIITGWFISRFFGMNVVEGVPAGRTVKVWNPTLQIPGWSTFPKPLLPTHAGDESQQWLLPQLLVSAGIALAEFGHSGDPEYIYGYRLLKYMGREVTTTLDGRDQWDGRGSGDVLPTGAISQSTYIKDWVITGRKPDNSLEVLRLLQSELGKDPDRRAALISTVEKVRAEYVAMWQRIETFAWNELPETWELKEDIDLALSDIIEYVKALHEGNEGSQIA